MSLASAETLVEQRVAQLEAISIRRNELLRQMYHMMRRRNNVGTVTDLDEADDGELQSFLQRFDIGKDLDMGSITNLNETDLFLRSPLQSSNMPRTPSPTLDKSTRRATRSQSRFTSVPKSPSPSLAKPPVTPPLDPLKLKPPVEQELTPDVQVGLGRDKGSSSSPLSDDEKPEADKLVKTENPPSVHSSTPPLVPPEVTEEAKSTIIEADQEGDTIKADEDSTMETPTPIRPPSVEFIRPEIPGKLLTEDSDADMENIEDAMEVGSEEEVSRTVDRPSVPPLRSISSPSSKEPIKSSIPFMHLGPSSPLPTTPAPRLPVIVLAPEHPAADSMSFTFEGNIFFNPDRSKVPPSTLIRQHHYNPDYTLPSLKILPSEFNRKVKTKSRRRDKDKERDKENRDYVKKDDWFPMGINKWAATLNANPVWKRVSRPTKCLSSREWGVAITELKLIRTFDRIESLKDSGRWSFRQPKKQRGVGGLVKTHWDYLMDEMKWMRIDFREERRWKIALAHALATAVMEWHAAGSLEERVLRGICVLWRPSHVELGKQDQDAQSNEETHETAVRQELPLAEHTAGTLLRVDLGLDAEENDQPNVVDVLQPQAMLEDALEVPSQGELQTDQEVSIKPKTEEIDDTFVLQGADELTHQSVASVEEKDIKTNITGLKSSSRNPILGTKADSNSSSNNGDSDTPATSTRSSLRQIYAPLRERLMESEIDQLFLDLDDFHISPPCENQDDSIELDLPPPDLSTIFPELQTLSVSDVVTPSIPFSEGRKKAEKRSDRDDPSKRTEDTTYTKLFPIGQFMHTKPTLIGPLQPSKNWKDGKWLPLDEPPVLVDYDGPTRPPENYMSDIFDNRLSNSTVLAQQQLMLAAARERDRDRKRTTEQQWSVNDDTLLKCLIDRFPYNWQLISESFNATRVTAPTDKRTARDCFERWREKWAPEGRRHPEAPSQAALAPAAEENTAASTSPMTTRGVKRLASSMAGNSVVNTGGSEPKKRRRHILLQDTIRKSAKKKAEFQQKMLSNQRKPSSVHDTHVPFNTMRYYSPAELSRMKADKDTKATQEVQLRRRQEEVARANIQARLTPAQQQSLVQQQQQLQQQLLQQQQQQQQPNQQPQQPGTPAQAQQQPSQTGQQTPQQASTPTQPATNTQSATPQVPQPAQVANIAQRTQNTLLSNQTSGNFRGQINISRFNSPNIAAGVQRLTAQQILQLQQARSGSQPAQASQGAHQLGQQGHIIMPSLNGNGTTLNSAHLTTSFVNRDSTSSPAHLSPPRKSATPTNVNSPRITADQVQHGQVQIGLVPGNQGTGNTMARPLTSLSYLPGLTNEQLSALRLQLMQQQQQQQQQGSAQQDGSTQ